jgi:hypothetical protein
MTITKMMMTSTPMMTPIIPRFMAEPPLVVLDVPAHRGYKPSEHLFRNDEKSELLRQLSLGVGVEVLI